MNAPLCPAACLKCGSFTVWSGSSILCSKPSCGWSLDSTFTPALTWGMYHQQVLPMVDLVPQERRDDLLRALTIDAADAITSIRRFEESERLDSSARRRERRERARYSPMNKPVLTPTSNALLSELEQRIQDKHAALEAIAEEKSRIRGPKAVGKNVKKRDSALERKKRAAARKARKSNR